MGTFGSLLKYGSAAAVTAAGAYHGNAMMIGAGIGMAKGAHDGDKDKAREKRQKAVEVAKAKYTPWTGQHGDVNKVQGSDEVGAFVKGGAQGAAIGGMAGAAAGAGTAAAGTTTAGTTASSGSVGALGAGGGAAFDKLANTNSASPADVFFENSANSGGQAFNTQELETLKMDLKNGLQPDRKSPFTDGLIKKSVFANKGVK